MKSNVYLLSVLMIIMLLSACGDKNQPAAPVGEHAVLEQLAQAYGKVGEQYPIQPQAMAPEGRKKFVELVFKHSGYSYSATLIALAQPTADKANKEQRDLAELLLLPVKGLSDEALTKLYTDHELAAVKQLRETFR